MIYFDSDYMCGAHPAVLRQLVDTNAMHSQGYGKDEYTEEAIRLIRAATAAPQALVQFLVGGTQTNATVIDALLRRHEGVLATEVAHIAVHEAGAIEHSGHKVLLLPHHEGKVTPVDVQNYIQDFYADDTHEHMVAPGMLYITQPTEWGTIYSLHELEQLSAICRRHKIFLYLDGARLAYALAAQEADFTLADLARLCDLFYIGGTKCGALFGEAVVAPNPAVLPHFFSLVKQHGALLAKGRLLGVQFATLFAQDLYLQVGCHANAMARRIASAFQQKGFPMMVHSPTNQQFITLPNRVVDRLTEQFSFEVWGRRGVDETTVRFVTDWATREEDVDALVQTLNAMEE